jgi:hypothetical protein
MSCAKIIGQKNSILFFAVDGFVKKRNWCLHSVAYEEVLLMNGFKEDVNKLRLTGTVQNFISSGFAHCPSQNNVLR